MEEGNRPRQVWIERFVANSIESLGNVKEHCTYILLGVEGLIYTTCQGSGGEEFGLSGKDGIQTEEGRAGCGCEDVMKADRWRVPASVLKRDLPRSPG